MLAKYDKNYSLSFVLLNISLHSLPLDVIWQKAPGYSILNGLAIIHFYHSSLISVKSADLIPIFLYFPKFYKVVSEQSL